MSPRYVEIAVNVAQVQGLFHYHLPPELNESVQPGCLVSVPFGYSQVQGIVQRFVETPEVAETRAVSHLLDPLPVLSPAQMELARWLAEQSLSSLSSCLELMLPPGLSQHADTLYTLVETGLNEQQLGPGTLRLVNLLRKRGGELRGRQIEDAMPRQNWKAAVQALVRRGWLRACPVLQPPQVRPKVVRTVQLACTPQEAEARMEETARAGTQARQRREAIVRFLMQEPWPVEAAWVYASSGGTLPDLTRLAELGLITLSETEVWRDPLAQIETTPCPPPQLTPDQQGVWQALQAGFAAAAQGLPPAPYLLQGVTGSGKTEIYLRAVEAALARGKQALVLVPEISLTPQTVRRFMARFPGQVGLVHSRLSPGERYDTWRRARAGNLPVIIGPRSALFTHLPNLGLIVIDECHEDSYYQDDFLPFYSAIEVGLAYARLTGSLMVLGSATPPVNLRYRAEKENWNLPTLPQRILAPAFNSENASNAENPSRPSDESHGLPPVTLIDMRQELTSGNRSMFSRALQAALRQVTQAGQQAILFLNRRGSATYVFCRQCGHSLLCPRCDLPLTFHAESEQLLCHTCGYRRKMPKTCPECGSAHIRQFGAGTEKVEAEVQALLPGVRTLRLDAETTRQKGSHEILLAHFGAHRADVLIGTQMLAKGLDLPLVTLVGVVLADVTLNLPDYRAAERTFQLLTQVAGRAGRSTLGGQVIFQTFLPDHYAIRAAALHAEADFYRQELLYRQQLHQPPFYRLVRLEYRHASAETAREQAQRVYQQLAERLEHQPELSLELVGPTPCFFSKQNGLFRWQILIRGNDPLSLLRRQDWGDWRIEVDPPSIL